MFLKFEKPESCGCLDLDIFGFPLFLLVHHSSWDCDMLKMTMQAKKIKKNHDRGPAFLIDYIFSRSLDIDIWTIMVLILN